MMMILRVAATLCVLVASVAAQTGGATGARTRSTGRQTGSGARSFGKIPPALSSSKTAVPDAELVERIFVRHYDALGDPRAMASLRTRIMRGYVNHSKSSQPGTIEYYAKFPNKTLAVLNIPGGVQFIEGFDGSDAWLQTPFSSALVFDQSSSTFLDRDAEVRRKSVREMYASTKYKGRGEVDGRAVEKVEAVRAGYPPMLLYFEVGSGLLARADLTLRPSTGEKGVAVSVIIDRYAAVDGIKLPVAFRFAYPGHVMTYSLYEIKHNVPISDTLFDKPQPPKAKKEETH